MSKKNRQHNAQKKKGKQDEQRSTQHSYKTKYRVTRTPQKTGGELTDRNNSPQVHCIMLLHLDTLSPFRASQSVLLLFIASLAGKHNKY
jgi:hypothetical protein